jgi:hypothetical protein
MEKLKVWTFHLAARNTIVFVLLSVFFVLLQKSLQANLPYLNPLFLKRALEEEWPTVLVALVTAWSLVRHRSYSKHLFAFLCLIVSYSTIVSLILSFNKILMVVLFIYVCTAFAIYQFLENTFTSAIFLSNYRPDQLNEPMALKIPVKIKLGDQNTQGFLTNWDDEGVFVYLDASWESRRKDVELEVELKGNTFGAKGTVVTATWDRRGIGVEWKQTSIDQMHSWQALMDLFDDYGWTPKLLR